MEGRWEGGSVIFPSSPITLLSPTSSFPTHPSSHSSLLHLLLLSHSPSSHTSPSLPLPLISHSTHPPNYNFLFFSLCSLNPVLTCLLLLPHPTLTLLSLPHPTLTSLSSCSVTSALISVLIFPLNISSSLCPLLRRSLSFHSSPFTLLSTLLLHPLPHFLPSKSTPSPLTPLSSHLQCVLLPLLSSVPLLLPPHRQPTIVNLPGTKPCPVRLQHRLKSSFWRITRDI